MKTTHSLHAKIALTTVLTGWSLNAAAGDELLSPALYGDELDRCIAQIRPQLETANARSLRHVVTTVDKRSAWYVFSIRSETRDADTKVIASVYNRCRAHRWQSATVIDSRARAKTRARLAAAE